MNGHTEEDEVMSDQVNASELLQRLLDERFEAGREAGYEQALGEILDAVKAKMTPGGQVWRQVSGSTLTDDPDDENDADPEDDPPLQPHQRRALEYVERHPGVTRHQAAPDLGNRNVLYELARLGFVEKRGPQFFPKNAEMPG
jgi:hypothetical protein